MSSICLHVYLKFRIISKSFNRGLAPLILSPFRHWTGPHAVVRYRIIDATRTGLELRCRRSTSTEGTSKNARADESTGGRGRRWRECAQFGWVCVINCVTDEVGSSSASLVFRPRLLGLFLNFFEGILSLSRKLMVFSLF